MTESRKTMLAQKDAGGLIRLLAAGQDLVALISIAQLPAETRNLSRQSVQGESGKAATGRLRSQTLCFSTG